MKIGYIRVSSASQSLSRQEIMMKTVGVQKVFSDVSSGKNTDREGLRKMISFAREGDEIFVVSMDRLGRSLRDLLQLTQSLVDRQIAVHFLQEKISLQPNTTDPVQALMLSFFGAFAEFERKLLLIRQREGIDAARAQGRQLGRKRLLTDEQLYEIQGQIDAGMKMSVLARKHGISPSTLSRNLKRLKQKQQEPQS